MLDSWKEKAALINKKRNNFYKPFHDFQNSLTILGDLKLSFLLQHHRKGVGLGIAGQALVEDLEMLRDGKYYNLPSPSAALDYGKQFIAVLKVFGF